jgi:hypothetical protein
MKAEEQMLAILPFCHYYNHRKKTKINLARYVGAKTRENKLTLS